MFCRYVCKGHDKAIAQVAAKGSEGQAVDEPKDCQDRRYLGTCEAVWRCLQFSLYEQSHSIVRLPMHLPNQQNVTFRDNSDLWETLQKPQTSQLLQWFELNKEDAAAQQLCTMVCQSITCGTRS